MTTTALLSQVKAGQYVVAGDPAACVDLLLQAYDDLAKLLAIVECMQAALMFFANETNYNADDTIYHGEGRRGPDYALEALLAADKSAGGE